MSPAPTRRHQRAVWQLGLQLQAGCPPELELLVAPLDWRPDRKTSLGPDVLVLGNRDLASPAAESMILAVEVLSPSSRRKDAIYKRSKYEDEGVPSYWIVDPEAPSILALDLIDDRYEIVGEAFGDRAVTVEKPLTRRLSRRV